MYWPHPAFNAWQLWADYDRERVARDLRRARDLGLDAVRVIASYELWARDALALRNGDRETNRLLARFGTFLDDAATAGVDVLPVLFESVGSDPMTDFWNPDDPDASLDRDALADTDVDTSFAMHSPSRSQVLGPRRWGADDSYPWSPIAFARKFTDAFGAHPSVLAVEAMNEPGGVHPRMDFAVDVAETIRATGPPVSVTVGTKSVEFARAYHDAVDGGLDVAQFHANFPPTPRRLRLLTERAADFAGEVGCPVWLTEWQRTRTEPPDRELPNYRSLASAVRKAEREGRIHGDFLWGLNFKPAYMERPRKRGRVNGVFHDDGTVFDADDAAAISGREGWDERHELPAWIRRGDHPWPAVEPRASRGPDAGEGVVGATVALGVFALLKWLSERASGSGRTD